MQKEGSKYTFQKIFVIILVTSLSLLFLYMIRNFITAILLAAIFTGMLYPVYDWLLKKFKGRGYLASGITVLLTFLLIMLPLMGLINIVAKEAISISQRLTPGIQKQLEDSATGEFSFPDWMPFGDLLEPWQSQIFSSLEETISRIGTILVNNFASLSQGTVSFIMTLFVLLYAMYFFFIRGEKSMEIIARYIPLSEEDFQNMVSKGMLVTFATIKGAVLIGILQGSLVGLAFWVVGIQAAFFWGTIAAVASVVPTFGCGLVWIPAVVYLLLTGQIAEGLGLLVWGAGVVGVVDNLLRPHLVGKDAHMPDLLILVSTLGGLGLFGATGFIIGPVLAGLLMTVWEIFRQTFVKELE